MRKRRNDRDPNSLGGRLRLLFVVVGYFFIAGATSAQDSRNQDQAKPRKPAYHGQDSSRQGQEPDTRACPALELATSGVLRLLFFGLFFFDLLRDGLVIHFLFF